MRSFEKFPVLLALLLALVAATGCLKSSDKVRGNVMGRVYDSNGHVLRGARVEVYGDSRTVKTDALGRYAIHNVDPGQRKLVATWNKESVILVVEIPRGDTIEGADLRFTVLDKLPPVITEVMVTDLGENTATIRWTTNEPSDSLVDYATGPIGLGDYVYLATDSAMVEQHAMVLTGLMPGTMYRFRVRSRDFGGNEGVSSDYQFMTPSGDAPSTPTGFAISVPTEMERITLTWAANTEADLVGYNLYRAETRVGPFERVNANPISQTSGIVSYTDAGLKVGIKYYYYLKAVDMAWNESLPTKTRSVVTPGILLENRFWKVSESPYVLSGDLRVRSGATLHIEPGTEVRFSMIDNMPDINGSGMTELIIQGALNAVGTANNRIVFTSAETFPMKGNWGGLYFMGTNAPENRVEYVTILFADTGLRSEGSSPVIENSEFGFCGVGLNIGMSRALNVRYNTIRNCDIGLISASSNIRNNLFTKNSISVGLFGADSFQYNTVDSLTGVEIHFGTPEIKNNIIAHSGSGGGMYGINQVIALATPSISFNNIHNFAIPFNGLTVATGTGNIHEDPLFIGGTPFDYRLRTIAGGYASDSPCLTAGENSTQMGRYGP